LHDGEDNEDSEMGGEEVGLSIEDGVEAAVPGR
jgi:hypothetical protein